MKEKKRFLSILLLIVGIVFFPKSVLAIDADTIYNEIAPNGILEANMIRPTNDDDERVLFSYIADRYYTKYASQGLNSINIECEDSLYEQCKLNIQVDNDQDLGDTYYIKVVYGSYNQDIYNEVQGLIATLKNNDYPHDENYYKSIYDMDSLEYLLNGRTPDSVAKVRESDLNKVFNGNKYTLSYGLEGEGGSPLSFGSGPLYVYISYEGFMYGVAYTYGISAKKIIYIADDTPNTTEAFIEAAQKRINNHFNRNDIIVSYSGRIADEFEITEDEVKILYDWYNVDADTTLGELYKIVINGIDDYFIIVKDSSKIEEETPFEIFDEKTGIKVESDNTNLPSDIILDVRNIDEDSTEYKDAMEKLGIQKGLMFDIKLYSKSSSEYLSKFDDTKFIVSVPIDESYYDKNLVAYYINDDGEVEEHKIEVKDGYAVFETDHFSTYVIAEKELKEVPSPNTSDYIFTLFILIVISLLCLALHLFKRKRYYF